MSVIGNGIYAGGGGGGPIIYDMSLDNYDNYRITPVPESLHVALMENKCSIRFHLFSEHSSSLSLEYPLIYDPARYDYVVFTVLGEAYDISIENNYLNSYVRLDADYKDYINEAIQMMYANYGFQEEDISIVGVSIVQYP
jgi:hypothetical protein